MKEIDICITATIRSKILEETLKSFTENMLFDKDQYRLIINIDPIGEKLEKKYDVLKVAKKYFKKITYNFPETPGFTKAVKWCWGQSKSKYIFHLEDDWKLLTKIDIDSMIKILNSDKRLVSLRLNIEETKENLEFSEKYGYVNFPRISLNPTLFKGSFIKNILPMMDDNKNPEKQLRTYEETELGKYLFNFKHGIYTKDSTKKVVEDIGRDWMKKTKYKKKIGFMYWDLR